LSPEAAAAVFFPASFFSAGALPAGAFPAVVGFFSAFGGISDVFGDWVESVLQSVCKRVDGEGVCFGGLLILIPSAAGTTINKIINKNYCVSACHAKIRGTADFNIWRLAGMWEQSTWVWNLIAVCIT